MSIDWVGRDRDLLAILGIGFALLAMMIAVVTGLRAWLGVYISTRLNLQLLDTLFARLLRLPLAWFEKRHIGDIVSRFRSVDAIQRTLTLTFLETVMNGVMVLVTLAVMLWYSPTLTLIVVIAAVCYGLLRWTMYGPQRRATDERIVHEAKAATHFIETLRGMMAIKLNLRESERRSAYLNHVVDQTNADVRVQTFPVTRAGNVLVFGIENVLVIGSAPTECSTTVIAVGMLFAFLLSSCCSSRALTTTSTDDRVPHARSARRPRCRHCAGRARGVRPVAGGCARRRSISALRVAGREIGSPTGSKDLCSRRRLCRHRPAKWCDRGTERRRKDHAGQVCWRAYSIG